jgi:hypothetical protein
MCYAFVEVKKTLRKDKLQKALADIKKIRLMTQRTPPRSYIIAFNNDGIPEDEFRLK